jgi:hypothetical protein
MIIIITTLRKINNNGIVDIGLKCEQDTGSIPLGSISLTEIDSASLLEMASKVLFAGGNS